MRGNPDFYETDHNLMKLIAVSMFTWHWWHWEGHWVKGQDQSALACSHGIDDTEKVIGSWHLWHWEGHWVKGQDQSALACSHGIDDTEKVNGSKVKISQH